VPDDKTGETVKLFVVRTPGATLSEADLVALCSKEMTA
jgi:long-chain acyl-CoA synthetase